jgi:hypothetical protein
MRYLSILLVTFTSALLAQQGQKGPYYSLGGYGNVVYPGTGHAPVNPPGGINGPHYFTGGGGAPAVQHPQHRRSSVVLVPVYYGGYSGYDQGYAGDPGQSQAADPNGAPPSVVINQGYVPPQGNPVVREYPADAPPEQPSGMRLYENPSHPYGDGVARTRSADDEQPTLYLIAFKDHSIVQALGYWMEGGALHYVSVEHTLNQVSMDLLDRDLSQRLNDERGVQFKLPAR